MRGPPVVLTNALGRPVTNVISERGAVPMVVVNTLGEPVTLVSSGGEPVTLLNPNGTLWDYPFSLFANNEQGAWYDPSDFSTLYQTSTGTTPVTAVEQPVGLMLDRSPGLVLGSERITNGDFSSATGWTQNAGWSISSGVATKTAGSASAIWRTDPVVVVGRSYLIQFTISSYSAGQVRPILGFGNAGSFVSGNGTFTQIMQNATNTTTGIDADASFAGSIDNISVRELPGNHATQATSASRPVLRARYNLLTFSEQFDNAAWSKDLGATITANAGVAPDETTTADRYDRGGTSASSRMRPTTPVQVTTGTSYVLSLFAKAETATIVTFEVGLIASFTTTTFDLSAVTVSGQAGATITPQANGWYRCIMPFTAAGTGSQELRVGSYGSTTGTLLLWGAQLLTAADQTSTGGAYQRIAAATDYDTSNPVFRPYLAFDGTDDSFGTSSIDFSGTDEMTVFAGVHKASDAALGMFAELSTNSGSNNGTFWVGAPINNGAANYDFASGGTTRRSATTNSYAAPITNVLTGIGDISADVARLQINGAQVATETSDQGTGNFGNYPLFIGRRNNASLPFNGRLYSLAVLGRTATAAEISAMEAWVNGKTGAY